MKTTRRFSASTLAGAYSQLTLEDYLHQTATARTVREAVMPKTLFQKNVEDVLKGHGLFEKFETQTDFHLRLEQEPYEPLVIEHQGESIYVTHYAKDAYGEEICDPDVELHFPDWTPVAIQMINGVYTQKFMERDGKEYVNTRFDLSVRPLLATWARNIKAQGWADPIKVKALE